MHHSQSTIEIREIPLTHLFTDDTGQFHPYTQSGNQYIMVGLRIASNAILLRPFASKHDSHQIPAYNDMYAHLNAVGAALTIHVMDNEESLAFQRAIATNKCKLQLVPPHVHRCNVAERAIRTFKDHFLVILAGTPPLFPANRWDLLIPQAELTLNLLRPTPNATATSVWEALFGPFNFDATPLAPAGCCVQIHNKPSLRRSWDFHAQDGFYIEPALQHYHCYRVLTKESHAVIVSDAIKFCPHNLPAQHITAEDKIIHALRAINMTISRMTPAPADEQLNAIETLRSILKQYMQQRMMTPPPGVPALVSMPLPTPGTPPPGVPSTPIPIAMPPTNIAGNDGSVSYTHLTLPTKA